MAAGGGLRFADARPLVAAVAFWVGAVYVSGAGGWRSTSGMILFIGLIGFGASSFGCFLYSRIAVKRPKSEAHP